MARTATGSRTAGLGLTFAGGATTDNVGFVLAANTSDQPLKSIAMWLKLNSAGGGNAARVFFWPGGAFIFKFSDSSHLQLIQAATTAGTWTISSNTYLSAWHHFAITYDRSGGSPLAAVPLLYVDSVLTSWGVSQTAQPTGTITADSIKTFILGNSQVTSGNRAVDGMIGPTYAYTRILSAGEVLNLYRQTDPSSTSLTLKWQPTEGSGLVTSDQSSNHMKGTILGATWGSTTVPLARTAASGRTAAGSRTAVI